MARRVKRSRKERQGAIMRKQIEQRKAALQRQGQELDRRLVEIDRQGQQLQQERSQVIANLNAVAGALQLCEELLKATADGGQQTPDPGAMTLEELKERVGANEVEFVPSGEQAEESEKVQG